MYQSHDFGVACRSGLRILPCVDSSLNVEEQATDGALHYDVDVIHLPRVHFVGGFSSSPIISPTFSEKENHCRAILEQSLPHHTNKNFTLASGKPIFTFSYFLKKGKQGVFLMAYAANEQI